MTNAKLRPAPGQLDLFSQPVVEKKPSPVQQYIDAKNAELKSRLELEAQESRKMGLSKGAGMFARFIKGALNKLDKPSYLGVKWRDIRSDLRDKAKFPTYNALENLQWFIDKLDCSSPRVSEKAQWLQESLDALRVFVRLDELNTQGDLEAYKKLVASLDGAPKDSWRKTARNLIGIYGADRLE